MITVKSAKQAAREKLARDVAEFEKAGGKIQELESQQSSRAISSTWHEMNAQGFDQRAALLGEG